MTRAPARAALVLVALSSLLLAGCSAPGPVQPSQPDVKIVTFGTTARFDPENFTVSKGITVWWRNDDPFGHTVTGRDNTSGISSPALGPGQWYHVTFSTPGRFWYYCVPHPWMNGNITVTPS